ncbi:MAG: T9SS type A sorting domain-containing protein [Bacteroidota bacterium]|nr:T9SS type A sorting domain-containing protein [Bacteroidota bacterium]
MKAKNIFYAFVLIILIKPINLAAWDTTAAKYYPLNIGNTFIYERYSLFLFCIESTFIGKYRITVEDHVLKPNGKMYYKLSGWWQNAYTSPGWKYQRIDSISMNVYSYDSISNSEYLLDSLQINPGNTFLCSRFNNQAPFATCTGSDSTLIFGLHRIKKNFAARYFAAITSYYSIGEGFGFIGFSTCELGGGQLYWLQSCVINGIVYGDTTLTEIQQVNSSIPENFSLSQNYPNPFNPSTVIRYSIPSNVKGRVPFGSTSNVKLVVYNSLGKEIATLINEKQNAGSYTVDFNGEGLSSGIYFYKLEARYGQAGDFVETKSMILLK